MEIHIQTAKLQFFLGADKKKSNFTPVNHLPKEMSANSDRTPRRGARLIDKHPVLANVLIILVVAVLGLFIAYLSLGIFTKHGRSCTVPSVEMTNYSDAIRKLDDAGFKTEIRDSVYRDDVKPGLVVEQFPKPGAQVKPGRKIFLYINAVHPKEVVIDDDPRPYEDALKSFSLRQGVARLQELGFKDIRIVKVLGQNDCIVKVIANGRTVKKTQKVPVNARIIIEVFDGRLDELRDSLQNAEYMLANPVSGYSTGAEEYGGEYSAEEQSEPAGNPATSEEEYYIGE